MRVLVFTLRDLTITGGSLVRILGLTRHLADWGCEVTLIAPNFPTALAGQAHFVPLPEHVSHPRLSTLYAAFPDLLEPLRLAGPDQALTRLCKSCHPDIIHVHQHDAGFCFLRLQSHLSSPIVFEIHGILRLQQEDLRAEQTSPFYLPLVLRAERNLFRRLGAIFVRTHSERNYLTNEFQLDPTKLFVVPDGADIEFLGVKVSEREKQMARQHLGLEGRKIIFYAGWFKQPSGIMDLVKAFQLLEAGYPQVALLLAGDGLLMPQVKAFLIEQRLSNVVLPGFISREQFRLYQQMADVVVTPEIKSFFNELGAPLKLFECLASGRPTVATHIASHSALIEDGVNGYLAEPGNPGDIARALARALDDPQAEAVGRRGQATMAAQHSWRVSARQAVQAYAEIRQRAGQG